MLVNAIKREKKQMYNKGEAARSMKIARKMLANGEPLDRVKLYTGLSAEAIRKLKAKIQPN